MVGELGAVGMAGGYATLAGLQPTGSDSLRSQAVRRVIGLARYLDVEIDNLREGVRQGHTAPRVIVEATIRQLDGMLIGNLEIRALRSDAERRLGSRFDILEFYDRVLESGAVTLPMLRQRVERWVQRSGG